MKAEQRKEKLQELKKACDAIFEERRKMYAIAQELFDDPENVVGMGSIISQLRGVPEIPYSFSVLSDKLEKILA